VAFRDYHVKRNVSKFIISYQLTLSINDYSRVPCSISLVTLCCLKIYNFRVLFWLNRVAYFEALGFLTGGLKAKDSQ
jgi:hypothetical protein